MQPRAFRAQQVAGEDADRQMRGDRLLVEAVGLARAAALRLHSVQDPRAGL